MLSSFWRRKNVRLVQRLNAAIEATDRMSETYSAPKPPRVLIDTSYVEHRTRQPTIARNQDDAPYDDKHPGDEAELSEHADAYGADESFATPENVQPFDPEDFGVDASLIKEVLAQLELAEQREIETQQELDKLRQQATELEAAATAAKEAQTAAEAASNEASAAAAAASAELAALRSSPPALATTINAEKEITEISARYEAKLMLEQAARRKAETQRDEDNSELEELRKSKALEQAASEANEVTSSRNSEMAQEIVLLRSRNDELAAEAAKTREALTRSETEVKAARRAADASRAQTASIREAADKATSLEKHLNEANARETELTAKVQSLESRTSDLNAEIEKLKLEHSQERETTDKEAKKKTDKAAAEIAALRLAAEHLAEQRARDDDSVLKRNETLIKDIEQMRGHIAGLESAASKERDAARIDAEKANAEITALRASARELTDHHVRTTREIEEHTTALTAEVMTLRDKVARLDKSRDTERKAAAKVAAEADSQINSLRGELDTQLKRAVEFENELMAAEAARLSAEFDRDNARKEARELEARLTASRSEASATPPAALNQIANEPPVFKVAKSETDWNAINTPAEIPTDHGDQISTAQQTVTSAPSIVTDVAEQPSINPSDADNDATGTPKVQFVTTQQLSLLPPPLPQTAAPKSIESASTQSAEPANLADTSTGPQSSPSESGEEERRGREKRMPSRMAVTLWTEAWGQPLSCFLVDKSSRGAKIEMIPDRIFGGTNRISVGDRLTLTFNYAQERTSVFCDVIWMDGNFLGVKYAGQFKTEIIKPRPAQRR